MHSKNNTNSSMRRREAKKKCRLPVALVMKVKISILDESWRYKFEL